MSLEEFVRICKQLDIEGVEFWDRHFPTQNHTFIVKLREQASSLGLDVIGIDVNNDNFTSPLASERRQEIEQVKRWIDAAVTLDARVVRILPGDLKILNSDPAGTYGLVKESLDESLKYARSRGVSLAMENGQRDTDPQVILRLNEELGKDHLGTCPDFGNFPADLRYQGLRDFAPYALHAHAKSYQFDQNGEETSIDYSQALQILKDVHYDSYLSAEYEGSGDALQGVRNTIALIKRNLGH